MFPQKAAKPESYVTMCHLWMCL